MKKSLQFILALLLFNFFSLSVRSQNGFVLLNEYQPWPGNACTNTAEFIEIFNFGPGPVDLGCYVITDGDYAVTIPPNNIIQPGGFFVLGGMNTIPAGCANIDSAIHVDLNWYTCGCTSALIPKTGDAFLTDGGSANEQVVLLDPAHQIFDAVVRKLPQESSSLIAINTLGGQCAGGSFNLASMNVQYEVVGESAGRANSFARKVDGDCGWVKDTQQSGGATNNTPNGDQASLTSLLYLVGPYDCSGNEGAVSIGFSDPTNVFPVKYILAFDADSNHQFTFADTYIKGVDSIGPELDITGLAAGYYTVAIEPATGCNYQAQSFTILSCEAFVLPIQVSQLEVLCGNNTLIKWTCDHIESVRYFEVEATTNGRDYFKVGKVIPGAGNGTQQLTYIDAIKRNKPIQYRVKLLQKNTVINYSNTVSCKESTAFDALIYPNPVHDVLNIRIQGEFKNETMIEILTPEGISLYSKRLFLNSGTNTVSIPVDQRSPGFYFVKISHAGGSKIYKFIKQ